MPLPPSLLTMVKRFFLVVLGLIVATAITFGAITFLRSQDGSPAQHGGTAQGPTEEDDDFGTVTVYSVNDDGTLDPAASGLTEHVWETFKRVVTPDFASEVMTQYRVGDAPKSDTLAYVYQDDDPDYWILAANLATSKDDADLIGTLVHEYAHILTLDDATQLDQHVASCDTLDLEEGCAGDDSYLWSFQQQFWSDYTDAPDDENTDGDVGYDFYLAHEDDFVDDYAATNVVEDIAESFMTFVLEEQPDGDAVIAQKLDFFWNYPELIAIRERIRDEFQVELGL
jgi:hypothetical protein